MDTFDLVAAVGCGADQYDDTEYPSENDVSLSWITYAARRNPVGLFCAIYVKINNCTRLCVRFIGLKMVFWGCILVAFFGTYIYNDSNKSKTTSEEVVLMHTCAAGRTGDFEESLFELVV